MIVSNGLGCGKCGGNYRKSIEEGLEGILGGLGITECEIENPTNPENCGEVAGPDGFYSQSSSNAIAAATLAAEQQAAIAEEYNNQIMIAQAAGVPANSVNNVAAGVVNNIPAPIVSTTPTSTIATIPNSSQVIATPTTDNPFLDWLGLSSTPSADMISGIPNLLIAAGVIVGLAFAFGGERNE